MHAILNIAKPTTGDADFYKRWDALGNRASKPEEATVLVVDHRVQVTSHFLRPFRRLKIIATANTGHTHIKVDTARMGIRLISLQGERAFLNGIESVSEFVLGLIFRLSRPLNGCGVKVGGKTISVIGAQGRIGLQVSGKCKALGMSVIEIDQGSSHQQWQDAFRQADYVTIHVTESEKTKGLITRELLDLMKPTSFFINTARGSVVNEVALSEKLHRGELAGAAVDTIENENALNYTTPRLIISEHVAGSTLEDRIKTDEFIVRRVRRLIQQLDTEPLPQPW